MRKGLLFQEILFLFIILGLLLSIAAISFLSKTRIEKVLSKQIEVKEISLAIEGEVQFPGLYPFSAGISLGEALKKAKPTKYADWSLIDKNRVIDSSCTVCVPKLEKILVSVEGAVLNPGTFEMPLGARISDLKKRVIFHEKASSPEKLFKGRRLLRQGEKIFVPFQEFN